MEKQYIDKVHAALAANLSEQQFQYKNDPEGFKAAMQDQAYATKVFQTLDQNLSPDQFQFKGSVDGFMEAVKKKDISSEGSGTGSQANQKLYPDPNFRPEEITVKSDETTGRSSITIPAGSNDFNLDQMMAEKPQESKSPFKGIPSVPQIDLPENPEQAEIEQINAYAKKIMDTRAAEDFRKTDQYGEQRQQRYDQIVGNLQNIFDGMKDVEAEMERMESIIQPSEQDVAEYNKLVAFYKRGQDMINDLVMEGESIAGDKYFEDYLERQQLAKEVEAAKVGREGLMKAVDQYIFPLAEEIDKTPFVGEFQWSLANFIGNSAPAMGANAVVALDRFASNIRNGEMEANIVESIFGEDARQSYNEFVGRKDNDYNADWHKSFVKFAQKSNERGGKFSQAMVDNMDEINSPVDLINYVGAATGQAAGSIPTSVATMGASAFLMEVGEIYGSQLEKIAEQKSQELGRKVTVEEVVENGWDGGQGTAVFGGMVAGALEYVGARSVMGAFSKKELQKSLQESALKKIRENRTKTAIEIAAKDYVAKKGVKPTFTDGAFSNLRRAMVGESSTEFSQTIIEQVAADVASGKDFIESWNNINWDEVQEAAVQGGVGALVLSGANPNTYNNKGNKDAALKDLNEKKKLIESIKQDNGSKQDNQLQEAEEQQREGRNNIEDGQEESGSEGITDQAGMQEREDTGEKEPPQVVEKVSENSYKVNLSQTDEVTQKSKKALGKSSGSYTLDVTARNVPVFGSDKTRSVPVMEVKNDKGKAVTGKKAAEVRKAFKQNYDYSQGELAPEVQEIGQDTPSYIAEQSSNPAEIAQAFIKEQENYDDRIDYKERVIRDHLTLIDRKSWIQEADNNLLAMSVAKNYLRTKKVGSDQLVWGLDQQAQDLSDIAGIEITMQDIIDFTLKYPQGPRQVKNPVVEQLKEKFQENTGFELTEDVARIAASQIQAARQLQQLQEEALQDEVMMQEIAEKDLNLSQLEQLKDELFSGFPFTPEDYEATEKYLKDRKGKSTGKDQPDSNAGQTSSTKTQEVDGKSTDEKGDIQSGSGTVQSQPTDQQENTQEDEITEPQSREEWKQQTAKWENEESLQPISPDEWNVAATKGLSNENINSYIAENSNSPTEIAAAFMEEEKNSPVRQDLQDRFKDMTGLELTEEAAKSILPLSESDFQQMSDVLGFAQITEENYQNEEFQELYEEAGLDPVDVLNYIKYAKEQISKRSKSKTGDKSKTVQAKKQKASSPADRRKGPEADKRTRKAIKIINNLFPGLSIVTDKTTFDSALREAEENPNEVSAKFHKGDQVKGFVFRGQLFLDPDTITPDTPFHEASHIFIPMMKEAFPALYRKGRYLLLNTPLMSDVLAAYPEYQVQEGDSKLEVERKRDLLAEEVMATAIGLAGSDRLADIENRTLREKISTWWQQLINEIRRFFGAPLKFDLSNMDMDDFMDLIAGEITQDHYLFNKPITKQEADALDLFVKGDIRGADIGSGLLNNNKIFNPPLRRPSAIALDARSEADIEASKKKLGIRGNWFRYVLTDYIYNYKRAIYELVQGTGTNINEKNNVAKVVELSKSKWNQFSNKLVENLIQAKKAGKTAFMERLAQAGITPSELGLFMYAQHASERNAQNLMDQKTAQQAMINELTIKINALRDKIEETQYSQKGQNTIRGIINNAKIKIKELNDRISALQENNPYPIDGYLKINFDENGNPNGSGMTNKEAQDIIDKHTEDGNLKDMEKFAEEFRNMVTRPLVEKLRMEGMMDDATYAKLSHKSKERAYDFYVPLFVEEEEIGAPEYNFSPAGGLPNASKDLFRRSKGGVFSYKRRMNPIVGSVMQYMRMADRMRQNEERLAFLRFLRANPEPTIATVTQEKIIPQESESGDFIGLFSTTETLGENDLGVLENGKFYRITVHNTRLKRAFNLHAMAELTELSKNILMFAAPFMNLMRNVFTKYNPTFILTNFVRDYETALMNSYGYRDLIQKKYPELDVKSLTKDIRNNTVKGWKAAFLTEFKYSKDPDSKWGQLYREVKELGGLSTWNDLTAYPQDITDMINKSIKKYDESNTGLDNTKEAAMSFLRNVGATIESANTASEVGARIAAYESLVRNGVSKQDAAVVAKNLTVNFEKKGLYGNLINAMYLFYNAGIQGSAIIFNLFYRSPKFRKAVAYGMLGNIILNYINYALLSDDEDDEDIIWNEFYDGIPQYEKDTNLILMLPFVKDKHIKKLFNAEETTNGQAYVKVPLPYGFNFFKIFSDAIFESSVEFTRHGMTNQNIADMTGRTAHKAFTGFLNAFNPFGVVNLKDIAPTFTKPFVEAWINEDWLGRPIYRETLPFSKQEPWTERSFEGVSPVAKKVEQILALTGDELDDPLLIGSISNAEALEHYYLTFSGGLGKMGANIGKMTDSEQRKLRNAPLLRKFAGRTSEAFTLSNKIYDVYFKSDKGRITDREFSIADNAYKKIISVDAIPDIVRIRKSHHYIESMYELQKLYDGQKKAAYVDPEFVKGLSQEQLTNLNVEVDDTEYETIKFGKDNEKLNEFLIQSGQDPMDFPSGEVSMPRLRIIINDPDIAETIIKANKGIN